MEKLKKIISENSDGLTIILAIIGFALSIYLAGFRLPEAERSMVNIFTIIGTIASFFGLAIAFIQIIALREISEITQNTISSTKDKLILGLSISDVTEAIKLISEIDNFLGHQKYEIARLKLLDLRDKLIQFKSSQEFKVIMEENAVNEIIDALNVHISNLYNVMYSEEGREYSSSSVEQQLQKIGTHLTDFKNRIKYQTV